MSVTVCKFYSLNQTCRFGKHCKFSHELTQRPPPFSDLKVSEKNGASNLKRENLDQNRSDKGDHNIGSLEVRPTTSQSINHPSLLSPLPPNNDDINLKESRNASSRSEVEASDLSSHNDRSSFQQSLCTFYSANGWCRYGRNCKFSHIRRQPRKSAGATQDVKKDMPPRFCKPRNDLLPTFSSKSCREDVDPGNTTYDLYATSQVKPTQGTVCSIVAIAPRQGRKKHGQPRKMCAFFKAGGCKWGSDCKFSHMNGEHPSIAPHNSNHDENAEISNTQEKAASASIKTSDARLNLKANMNRGCYRPPQRPPSLQQVFTFAELDKVGTVEIRNREIETIKRRFPKDSIDYSDGKGDFTATFKFVPSDPDWPFDVKEFTIAVIIPPDYPRKTLSLTLPLDQDLPATVRRYLEVSIQEWVQQRQENLTQKAKAELLFRPFLLWLDRNIEDLTTEALKQLKRELTAKAAGLEFIPAQKLQARFQTVSRSSQDESIASSKAPSVTDDDEDYDDDEADSFSSSEDDDTSSGEEETDDKSQTLELQPQQKGTEISLKHLQLKENVAALLFQRLKVTLQCGRCKGHEDIYITQGSVVTLTCGKCNNSMYINYRPSLIHQFTSILGYLDVDGCQAFDLILQDCRVSVSCMSCNKQTAIDGLVTGQIIDGWCKACNAKFRIATEAVKLTHLVPSGVDTSSQPVVEVASSRAKNKKPPKDPSIREGYPLPEFGTCKHYKHSYRWLRFPCCGKAYPCDVCHDKQEDHEMILANRMICGHCCKEQNYSGTRPCSGCGEHMTKTHSAHWEGGSGCRDKIAMSKGDNQKYKNMNKTISRKKLESKPKKKNTKLRHT